MFYDFESSHYSQNSASYVQLKFRNSSPPRGNQPPEGHETLPSILKGLKTSILGGEYTVMRIENKPLVQGGFDNIFVSFLRL